LKALLKEHKNNAAALARHLGLAASTVKQRLNKIVGPRQVDTLGNGDDLLRKSQHIMDLLAKNNIDPDAVGDIKKVRIGTHRGFIKDEDNKIQTVDLPNMSVVFEPTWKDGPKWPVVQPAPPAVIRYTGKARIRPENLKVAVITADNQIGYWRDEIGEESIPATSYETFHDEHAMDVVLQICHDIRPDRSIEGGDVMDLAEWQPKYPQQAEFQRTTQMTLNRTKRWLAEKKSACGPQVQQDYCEGNHEARLPNLIIKNALAAHGIKRAWLEGKEKPDAWPIHSVPMLLGLDEMGIRYSAAWPGGVVRLAPYLAFQHQPSKVSEERATIIYGDNHRREMEWRTVHLFGEKVERGRIGVGCLCRVDEPVDNIRQRRMRSAIPAVGVRQNWQQGMLVVTYLEDGGPNDFDLTPVRIVNGSAFYNGKRYESRLT